MLKKLKNTYLLNVKLVKILNVKLVKSDYSLV